jgi:hypothetical protein
MGLPGSGGLAAVPPPPSIAGSGAATARGGKGLAGGSGLAVVPPTPSMEGVAGTPGRGAGAGPGGGLGLGGGPGSGAVPPAPSGGGGTGLSGRSGLGLGDGSSLGVVPPAPSVEGSGGASARGGMGLGDGSGGAVPPAPSMEGSATSSGGGGTGLADSDSPVGPPPSTAGTSNPEMDPGLKTVVEELHMRIVGLAFALPSTSFASNYEVFIAERQVSAHTVQLIKLVYWFLPYQRRMSEYHPDYSKMYKLRATRDHACDESFVHMTVSATGQSFSSAQLSTLSPGFPSGNQDIVLPCFRTTADDYRKALSRTH